MWSVSTLYNVDPESSGFEILLVNHMKAVIRMQLLSYWRQSDRHYHHHWVPPNSSKRGRWQAKVQFMVWDSKTPKTPKTPGLYLYIWRPFLFSLYCYLLECNEIYPSVKHKAWGLLIGFSSLLEYEITQNASLRLIWSHTALCGYPHKKVSIRDLSQIFTTDPHFEAVSLFQTTYLSEYLCPVSLIYLWNKLTIT